MHTRRRNLFGLALVVLSACAGGFGTPTAATRPLLGQTVSNDDAQMWAPASNQLGVPAGFVRMELVEDRFARIFNYVTLTAGTRLGNATPTVAGVEQQTTQAVEIDATLAFRVPLPIGGLLVGGGHGLTMEGDTFVRGFGVRASAALLPQFSVDFARTWVSGTYEDDMRNEMDISGTRTSLGATLLVWGYRHFRFGVAIAKAWTKAEPYESSGYTYQLVWSLY
jgi:hypothetical protein